MSACGTQDQSEKRFAPWRGPTEVRDTAQKRNMLTEALGIALSFVTKNYAYTFDNEIFMRYGSFFYNVKEGAIEPELTGVRLKTDFPLKVRMYKRYVDDINLAMTAVKGNMGCKEG